MPHSSYTRCPCCGDDTVSSDATRPELCELCTDAGCEARTGIDGEDYCRRTDELEE